MEKNLKPLEIQVKETLNIIDPDLQTAEFIRLAKQYGDETIGLQVLRIGGLYV